MFLSLAIWWISFFFCIFTVALHAYALDKAKRFFIDREHRRPTLKIMHYTAYAVWLHWIEIILFGLLFWVLSIDTSIGIIDGAETFHDYMYFSATTYTSLGFGDLYPTGHLRIIAGTEALTGLMMISWSAVFAMRVAQHDS
jgi:hypothetical protein